MPPERLEKSWESIVGHCDEFLYLGGNEQSTHEYVSKLLGRETIDVDSYGRTRGRSGGSSVNRQTAGRELMAPDEVRALDSRYALLFIRGERPVLDLKYDVLRHPNVGLTEDGGAEPYRHGGASLEVASVICGPDGDGAGGTREPGLPDLHGDRDGRALPEKGGAGEGRTGGAEQIPGGMTGEVHRPAGPRGNVRRKKTEKAKKRGERLVSQR